MMNILSLFDGMSCGQIALERAGIPVDTYYASEIKGHAIAVTQKNYPKTIQLGDVTTILPQFLPQIDLLIGGSPCQDFSQANKDRKGVEGVKSGLFWEYVRILRLARPKYFLLENVKMKKDQEEIISEALGVKPININSSQFTGQLRNRYYWTNIPVPEVREEKTGPALQSVLSSGYTNREKAMCLLESDSRPSATPVKMFHRYYAKAFTTLIFKNAAHFEACEKHYNENYKGFAAKDIQVGEGPYEGVRYLETRERERLQTVPPGYTDGLTKNEAACLLGDGWTVDVIAHIFGGLK